MTEDCVKLTTYFGERDRVDGGFLADAISDIYARHELRISLVLRGVEGFGIKHRLRTDRLLTLSEDLPVVSVAVDRRERIEPVVSEVARLRFDGLVTLERARMLVGPSEELDSSEGPEGTIKLTVYVGRKERADGRPAYEAIVELLRQRGIAGATVLLGVDGTAHGERTRARFFGSNAQVPLMIIAVGRAQMIAKVLPDLSAMLAGPLITLERIQVCKRDGELFAAPARLPENDRAGLAVWQKLMVYVGEQAQHDGERVHRRLVRELRAAGAAGATSLRGIWGYHGEHRPHGDSFWQLRRRVPIVTVIVDTPQRIGQWFPIVDELTAASGLVTSETVPALRATASDLEHGDLRFTQLTDPHPPGALPNS